MQTRALSMLRLLILLAHRVHISLGDLIHVCVGYLSLLPFASFICTLNSKEVLGILSFGLTWRAPSSCIELICVLPSCSLSLIMALSVFLFGQSRAQCGLSHRKHLILGVNSFLSALPLPSQMLSVLPDPILGALWSLETSSPSPVVWLSSKDSTLEESPLL